MSSSFPISLSFSAHTARRTLVCFVCAAFMALGTSAAHAAEPNAPTPQQLDEARDRYMKGVELFDEADYAAALIEFKRSYELAPNVNVLFNIGQVYFQLADYAHALETLQRYMDEGGKRIPAARRAEVKRDIDKLKSRVATVVVDVNVAGAEVLVDGEPVALTSEPFLVGVGRHRFDVTKPGYVPQSKTQEVAGEEHVELRFELQPLVVEAPLVRPPSRSSSPPSATVHPSPHALPPPPPPASSPVGSIVSWSLAGALGVGAGVFGTLALLNDVELQDLKRTPGTSEEDLTAAASDARTLAIVSDGFLAATVVAAGVAAAFTLVDLSDDEG